MEPTPPPNQQSRLTYNQVRLSMRGYDNKTGHPVGSNTDRMPTPNFFQKLMPVWDSYAEILGKVGSPLVTLGGTQRATEEGKIGQGRETEKEKPTETTLEEERESTCRVVMRK